MSRYLTFLKGDSEYIVKLTEIKADPILSVNNIPPVSLNSDGTSISLNAYYLNSHLNNVHLSYIYNRSDVILGDTHNFAQTATLSNRLKTVTGSVAFQNKLEYSSSAVGTITGRSWLINGVSTGEYPNYPPLYILALAASIEVQSNSFTLTSAELFIPSDYKYIYKITFETVGGDTYTIYPCSLDLISEDAFRAYYGDRLLEYEAHSDWIGSYIPYTDTSPFPINDVVYEEVQSDEPYAPGGNSTVGGGGGNFGGGIVSDNVVPSIPIGSTNAGLVSGMYTQYVLTASQLKVVGDWLWADNFGTAAARALLEYIFGNANEALISLTSYPFNLNLIGIPTQPVDMYFGNYKIPFNAQVPAVTSPYTQVDWGTITLDEYWGNFLDFAPHTKIELYLPWGTGFVDIDPGQCLPGTLNVKTNIEVAKGTCVHIVTSTQYRNGQAQTPTVIGTYEGTIATPIPMTSSDFASKMAIATIVASGGLVMGVAGGAAMASSAIKTGAYASQYAKTYTAMTKLYGLQQLGLDTVANETINYMQNNLVPTAPDLSNEQATYRAISPKSFLHNQIQGAATALQKQPVHVSRNGSFGASASGMNIQYPYVIISRPEQNVPQGYGQFYGYPSNITTQLITLRGYTEISAIRLTGVPATPDEIAELSDMLTGGFIV